MKINSISGVVCYASDIAKTAQFYETLGFRIGKQEADSLTVYVNWFWITFRSMASEDKAEFKKEATTDNKGAGTFLCMKVESVDDFYKEAVAQGLKPSSQPRDWPWGNREFVLRDPDGYKLVFFQKL